MRRAALPLALLAAIALAHPAASQEHGGGEHGTGTAGTTGVTATAMTASARIGFDAVRPQRLDIVTGDSVRWTNESSRVHTATADDESFDSGRMSSSDTYTHRFTTPGVTPYHCQLHPLITGVVGVHDLLLQTLGQAAAPKRPFSLAGRSTLEAETTVSIEADSGTGFARVASARVNDDGSFAARFTPEKTVSIRAVAGSLTSPIVNLVVLDRRVSLRVRRGARGRVRLQAKVTPATGGGRVVLQLFLPHRFGWWPVQQKRLGASSSASFTLHPRRRLRARVRYTLADGATTLATSRIVRIAPARKPARSNHHH